MRITADGWTARGCSKVGGHGTVAAADGSGVLVGGLLGAAHAAGPLVLAALAQPQRMGGGDVKLTLVVGALLGGIDRFAQCRRYR